jgi:hypothetical protein
MEDSARPPEPAGSTDAEQPGPTEASAGGDPLAGFDEIIELVAHEDRQLADRAGQQRAEVQAFLVAFQAACQAEVRPAMETVLDRLRRHGGGGLIEEHPGGEARYRNPCLILWMSLQGEIVGEPRPDREPYLQVEADVGRRDVQVSEGDMWRGAGGKRSGRVGHWELSDLTRHRITDELLAIARRAVS